MNNDLEPSLYWRIRRAISSFGATEKIVFSFFALLFICSSLIVLEKWNRSVMTDVPIQAGTLKEGIIGFPSAINPVLAYTDADKDLTALVYSGLLKYNDSGDLVPDLAASYTVSPDGLTYDFVLKPTARFQDGYPVTADDVIFTIQKIQDPTINSPKAANWSGVTVTKVTDQEVKFTLKKAYAPFIENLTLGMLPKHVWQGIDDPLFSRSTYNQYPIGSGPYTVKDASQENGLYQYYDLVPFDGYTQGAPFIEHVILRFYKTEESALSAYHSGEINALGGISTDAAASLAAKGAFIKRIPLPRIFAVFFNQSAAPVLLNKEVRQALDVAVDRDTLITEILHGYGVRDTGPIPAGFISEENITAVDTATTSSRSASSTNTDDAKNILLQNGWKPNNQGIMQKNITRNGKSQTVTLQFTLSTSNVPELEQTAELIVKEWQAIGADVKLAVYDQNELTQKVIRPRTYDALLFGNVVGRDLDLYPFWDSSERNDPGLNIAMYANAKADKFLEAARTTASTTLRDQALQGFVQEVHTDIPAIFLYSPEYIYVLPRDIQNATINKIISPSDRFMNVNEWYTETQGVWNMFISH